MKKKIFLILVVLLLGVFIYIFFTQPISIYKVKDLETTEPEELHELLTKEEVKEDIESIIEIVESTHPIFLEEVPEKYYKMKEELLSTSNNAMTVGELQNKISRYLSSINDGHTSLRWEEEMFLDVNWIYKDGKLILLDKDSKPTNKTVTKIGNVDIDLIIKTIQDIFPAENYMAEAKNIAKFSKGKLILENTGVEPSKNITLTLENMGKEETIQVEFTSEDKYKKLDYSIYSEKIDNNNTAYIRLGICEVNPDLEKVVEDIGNYLNEGITNFIIDVSDNPGGNSMACSMILETLKIKPGSYGAVVRFSPLAQEQRGYLRRKGHITHKGSMEAEKNDDISLHVLTNENTFSSAQMLAVWVSDGDLGTLVGRPSANSPSSYGDVVRFQLKNSKILGQVSHKKWTRPDINKDNKSVLEPDIYVDYGDNIIEKALKEIK